MSQAPPLTTTTREAHYRAQTGRTGLTPAQARRTRHKQNEASRPVPVRIGRLRRRYDRKADVAVRTRGRQLTVWVRNRIDQARFAPKPGSKRQLRKAHQSRRTP